MTLNSLPLKVKKLYKISIQLFEISNDSKNNLVDLLDQGDSDYEIPLIGQSNRGILDYSMMKRFECQYIDEAIRIYTNAITTLMKK